MTKQSTKAPKRRYRKGQIIRSTPSGARAGERGMLFAVEGSEGALYTVRRYYPSAITADGKTGAYAPDPIRLPDWRLTAADPEDERLKEARRALREGRRIVVQPPRAARRRGGRS